MVQPQKKQQLKSYHNSQPQEADQVEIVYYTDPLCCWSWGLEPQWRRLRYQFHGKISWRYCMGGLIPGWNNYHDGVNIVSRPVQMGPVWMEAAHISGMPVYNKIWIEDPPASSYPACMAVKCAMLQSAEAGEQYLRLLREAVMQNGTNIASITPLTGLAVMLSQNYSGFDAVKFAEDMNNEKGLEAFRKDLHEVQTLNISRFPSLIMRRTGKPSIIITGYRPYKVLLDAFRQMAPDIQPVQRPADEDAYTKYWGSITTRELEEGLAE